MEWLDFISILGATLSGIGCIIAWKQANIARTERIAIQSDRKRLSIIESLHLAQRARDETAKIQKQMAKQARGLDLQRVVDKIKECINHISDRLHRIENQETLDIINQCIHHMNEYPLQPESQQYKTATEIYTQLNSLIRQLEAIKDESI